MPLPPILSTLTIVDEEFPCCLPQYHPLASWATLEIHDLAGDPLVMFNRNQAPHYYDRIVSLFHIADQEPSIKHEASHKLIIVALVQGRWRGRCSRTWSSCP